MPSVRNPLGGETIHLESVTSTMTEARRLSDAGGRHGTVICAEYQSAGRGRTSDRRWDSEPGVNLLATVILEADRIPPPMGRLPLCVGLAVAKVVESLTDGAAEIKWPNDVMITGSKVAGVLCESIRDRVFAGFGVNCNQRSFPDDLRRPATSIFLERGSEVAVSEVLGRLLSALADEIDTEDWREEVNRRLAFLGERVTVRTTSPDGSVDSGRYRVVGVGPEGELVLASVKGQRRIYGGEVDFVS